MHFRFLTDNTTTILVHQLTLNNNFHHNKLISCTDWTKREPWDVYCIVTGQYWRMIGCCSCGQGNHWLHPAMEDRLCCNDVVWRLELSSWFIVMMIIIHIIHLYKVTRLLHKFND